MGYKKQHAAPFENDEDKILFESPTYNNVGKIYPAIEISHFVVNSRCRNPLNSFFEERKRLTGGTVIFWSYIVEMILMASDLIGVEYACLFAADSTRQKTLVQHYKISFRFIETNLLGLCTNIESYDCRSVNMVQKIIDLKTNRQMFFENFNLIDEDDEFAGS